MIDFTIDALTPCLKNTETGELVETEVIRIKRKSFLSKYSQRNGWTVNWDEFIGSAEVYALVLKGTVDIQGLIAITGRKSAEAVYINWAVASPANNKWDFDGQKYKGVGGHLFAIAIAKSKEFGYGGTIYADASDAKILQHYVDNYKAQPTPLHTYPYRFIIEEEDAEKILEVYDFEWTEFSM